MQDQEEDLMEFSDDEICCNNDGRCSASDGDSNVEVEKDVYEDDVFEFDTHERSPEDEDTDEDSIDYSLDDGEYDEEKSRVRVPGRGRIEIKLSRRTDPDHTQCLQFVQVRCSRGGKTIGYANGQQIKRDMIRKSFYRSLQSVDTYAAPLVFEVFDRFGYLKAEFKEHPVRKGTGKWGDELSSGILFVVNDVVVDEAWQRIGLGTIMIKGLMARAERLAGGFDFALASPRWLGDVEFGVETQNNPKFGARITRDRHQDIAVAFFRSLGFRRVGVSSCLGFPISLNHKVHQISSDGDYDLEEPWADEEEESDDVSDSDFLYSNRRGKPVWKVELDRMSHEWPVHFAIATRDDYDCVMYFRDCLDAQEISDTEWSRLDHRNNNALHIAADYCMPRTCKWLIQNIDKHKQLRRGRNMKGYTPLESLRALLEDERVQISHGNTRLCISDRFTGYDINAVKSLCSLMELPRLPMDTALRLRYGCTCGACLEGFISPRMKFVLVAEAKTIYDTLNSNVAGEQWCGLRQEYSRYLLTNIRSNLFTNMPLRQSYANLFNHIASVLRRNKIPTKENVLDAHADTEEWPAAAQSYLVYGAKVCGGLKLVTDCAKSKDSRCGDGRSLELYADEMSRLPECRNDHEFGFVSRALGTWKVTRRATS